MTRAATVTHRPPPVTFRASLDWHTRPVIYRSRIYRDWVVKGPPPWRTRRFGTWREAITYATNPR